MNTNKLINVDSGKLKTLIENEAMTLREFREKCNLHHVTFVRLIEGGQPVQIKTLQRVCETLNCDLNDLVIDQTETRYELWKKLGTEITRLSHRASALLMANELELLFSKRESRALRTAATTLSRLQRVAEDRMYYLEQIPRKTKEDRERWLHIFDEESLRTEDDIWKD